MIFQHTWQKVLSGEKVQTRRIVKPGDEYFPVDYDNIPCGVYRNTGNDTYRTVFYGGQTLAVQPGRGKPAVARIRILGIRREDVRGMTVQDAIAEGFNSVQDYLMVWCEMHDSSFSRQITREDALVLNDKPALIANGLMSRPAARYDAWVLIFELVKS